MMYDFLRKVGLFADLPDADLQHLSQQIQTLRLPAGALLCAEGDPGDCAYVVHEGELEVFKTAGGREMLLNVCRAGDVLGEIALLEKTPRTASIRARSDARLCVIGQEQFEHLLNTSLTAATTLFHTMVARLQQTQATVRHSEKMAQLGTLTAGVAHELNNPAAAVKRGAGQLEQALEQYGAAQGALRALPPSAAVAALQARARAAAARPPELDALERSDREAEVEGWLDAHGVAEAWDLAPLLVNVGLAGADLGNLATDFTDSTDLVTVLRAVGATYTAYNLLAEIGQGAGRISEIVGALKSYSYLDQAPVQSVDIHAGLDNTLIILRSKLKQHIRVRREYAPDLPPIHGWGSELNQVWTNLIDNAADALSERGGEIVLRTRREGGQVLVEVEDDGPGIPPAVLPRIFEAFFTTKPPGKGTGLGLDISYRIVVNKHRGDIQVTSQPGRTLFQVWLPVGTGG